MCSPRAPVPSRSRHVTNAQKNCKVRGLVHFTARTVGNPPQTFPENMDLTPSRWTLQFSRTNTSVDAHIKTGHNKVDGKCSAPALQ
jgi:hypothetical protein